MKKLSVSPDLSLPLDAQTRTLIVLGGKGRGKTNFGSVLCEEFSAAGLRFCIVDPLDVWWGLRHGADRSTEGIPVVILGGTHGDMAIAPDGGKVAADFVADEAANTVIVMRNASGDMWTSGERIRFMRDFARALFKRQGEQRKPVHLVIDEAGRFVPQMPQRGDLDIADCIGAIEELVEWGRNVGIGVTLITQRSARMNKSVTELADTLVAFQTSGPNSIDAVIAWFGEHVDKKRQHELIERLRKLPVGRALIVSPEWLDFEGEAQIRLRWTFDSSATPKPGKVLRPGKARKIDLDRYKTRMKEVSDRAAANDPKTLAARIKTLEAQIAQRVTAVKASGDDQATKRAIAALEKAHALRVRAIQKELAAGAQRFAKAMSTFQVSMTDAVAAFGTIQDAMAATAKRLDDPAFTGVATDPIWTDDQPRSSGRNVMHLTPKAVATAALGVREQAPRPNRSSDVDAVARSMNGDGPLAQGERKVLGVIVQNGSVTTMDELAVVTGYKKSSRGEYIRRLLFRGYIVKSGHGYEPTDAGVAAMGDFEPLPKGAALLEHWRGRLPEGERKLLDIHARQYPASVFASDLVGESTGYQKSSVGEYLRRLTARRVIVRIGAGQYRLSDDLVDGDD